jgi:uncharacterized repeat protein (TIGR01451 family)
MLWTYLRAISLMVSMSIAATTWAAPQISLEVQAEKEVTVVNDDGESEVQRRTADNASPGDELFYTIRYRNSGDESATNVKIDNPIPEGAAYVADSAWGQDSEIFFSIDGGQTFKKPGSLTYSVDTDGEKSSKQAEPERYTHIRWVVSEIPAGSAGEAGFQARVQ